MTTSSAAAAVQEPVRPPFEFVWRNDELTNPPGQRPPDYSEEHRMESRITELDPPHRLAIEWGSTGGVSFELEPKGDQVLLTVVHHRVPDRGALLSVSSGWHTHLDILVARVTETEPEPFWDSVKRLKEEYGRRLGA